MPKDIDAGTYVVHAHCPKCGGSELVLVALREVLTVPADEVPQLKVRLKGQAVPHICNQTSIEVNTETGEITLPDA